MKLPATAFFDRSRPLLTPVALALALTFISLGEADRAGVRLDPPCKGQSVLSVVPSSSSACLTSLSSFRLQLFIASIAGFVLTTVTLLTAAMKLQMDTFGQLLSRNSNPSYFSVFLLQGLTIVNESV